MFHSKLCSKWIAQNFATRSPLSCVIASEISPVQAPLCFPGSQEKKRYQEASTSSLQGGEIRIYPWSQASTGCSLSIFSPRQICARFGSQYISELQNTEPRQKKKKKKHHHSFDKVLNLYFILLKIWSHFLSECPAQQISKSSQNSSKHHSCFSANGKALRKVRWDAGVREQSPFAS